MEGLPLPLDLIYYHICPHWETLDVIAPLMLVHTSWFRALRSDEAVDHIKRRILSHMPRLQPLFDQFSVKRTKKHRVRPLKRRRADQNRWIIKQDGSWYVFKRWIYACTNKNAYQSMYKRIRHDKWKRLLLTELSRYYLCLLYPSEDRLKDMTIRLSGTSYDSWYVYVADNRVSFKISWSNRLMIGYFSHASRYKNSFMKSLQEMMISNSSLSLSLDASEELVRQSIHLLIE